MDHSNQNHLKLEMFPWAPSQILTTYQHSYDLALLKISAS